MIASFQLSHVTLELTRLSDRHADVTTTMEASMDDSRDGVSYALQVESCTKLAQQLVIYSVSALLLYPACYKGTH